MIDAHSSVDGRWLMFDDDDDVEETTEEAFNWFICHRENKILFSPALIMVEANRLRFETKENSKSSLD